MCVSFLSPAELEKRNNPGCSNYICHDSAKFMLDGGDNHQEQYLCANCIKIYADEILIMLKMYRDGCFDSQEKLDKAEYKVHDHYKEQKDG